MLSSHGKLCPNTTSITAFVMDWARRNLEQSDWKDPGELVIAALIAGKGPRKSWE